MGRLGAHHLDRGGGLRRFGLAGEGPGAAAALTGRHLLAVGYLAVAVTAVAFVLWYSSVRLLGAGPAGLLTGVAPVAAAASGVALGGPLPGPLVWLGIAVVALGLTLGLSDPAQQGRAGTILSVELTAMTADAHQPHHPLPARSPGDPRRADRRGSG